MSVASFHPRFEAVNESPNPLSREYALRFGRPSKDERASVTNRGVDTAR
jgi:hypothetical protein